MERTSEFLFSFVSMKQHQMYLIKLTNKRGSIEELLVKMLRQMAVKPSLYDTKQNQILDEAT